MGWEIWLMEQGSAQTVVSGTVGQLHYRYSAQQNPQHAFPAAAMDLRDSEGVGGVADTRDSALPSPSHGAASADGDATVGASVGSEVTVGDASTAPPDHDDTFAVTVRLLTFKDITVQVSPSWSVRQLKARVQELATAAGQAIEPDLGRLLLALPSSGGLLRDDETLQHYGFNVDTTVYVVVRAIRG